MSRIATPIAFLLVCAGCQPERQEVRDDPVPLSFAQAKRLVDTIPAPIEDPPPRTIDDVLARLGPDRAIPPGCDPTPAFVEPKPPEDWDMSRYMAQQWTADDWMEIAAREVLKGDYRGALRFAEAAIELSPTATDFPGWERKSPAQRRLNRGFSNAVRSDFQRAAMMLLLSRYYALAGQLETAQTWLERGISVIRGELRAAGIGEPRTHAATSRAIVRAPGSLERRSRTLRDH